MLRVLGHDLKPLYFVYFLTIPWRSIISECTGPMFTKVSGNVDIWVSMINLTFFSRSLQGGCYGNRFMARIGEN